MAPVNASTEYMKRAGGWRDCWHKGAGGESGVKASLSSGLNQASGGGDVAAHGSRGLACSSEMVTLMRI